MKKRKYRRKSPNRIPHIDKRVHSIGVNIKETLEKPASIPLTRTQLRPPQVPVLPITDPNKTPITRYKDTGDEFKSKIKSSRKTSILDELRQSCTSFRSNNSNLFPTHPTIDQNILDKTNEELLASTSKNLPGDAVRIASAILK